MANPDIIERLIASQKDPGHVESVRVVQEVTAICKAYKRKKKDLADAHESLSHLHRKLSEALAAKPQAEPPAEVGHWICGCGQGHLTVRECHRAAQARRREEAPVTDSGTLARSIAPHREGHRLTDLIKANESLQNDPLGRAIKMALAHGSGVKLISVPDLLGALRAEKSLRAEQEKRIEKLKGQLPDDMKHCTIQFKQCELGHAWLTATNWVEISCPTCDKDLLLIELSDAKRELTGAITVGNQQRERAKEAERALAAEREHHRQTRQKNAELSQYNDKALARAKRAEEEWKRASEHHRQAQDALGATCTELSAAKVKLAFRPDLSAVRGKVEALQQKARTVETIYGSDFDEILSLLDSAAPKEKP